MEVSGLIEGTVMEFAGANDGDDGRNHDNGCPDRDLNCEQQ